MARTKQTARCSLVAAVPRRAPIKKARRSSCGRERSPSAESVELNTDQFSVKFQDQPECQRRAVEYSVVECKGCGAFLSSQSVVRVVEKEAKKGVKMSDAQKQRAKVEGARMWSCEYCWHQNRIPDDYILPDHENPCYIRQRAAIKEGGKREEGEKKLIFVVDISGSMDCSVAGKSRLAAVKEAITDEVRRMKFEKEKVRVGIITFGSLVTLYGESGTVNIPQQHYYTIDKLTAFCKEQGDITLPISSHHDQLKSTLKDLATYGSTALGPALVAAIEMAHNPYSSSKIILCTDGMANVGLNGPDFYSKAAVMARQKGVMVNILSIKGDSCNLKELGKLTLSTGGAIMKIDTGLLGSQFNKITKEEVLGSSSQLTIIVSRLFEIRDVPAEQLSRQSTVMKADYGNFTADTELTFNFRTLSKEEAVSKGIPAELLELGKASMQVQLSYTNPQGHKYTQVITDYRTLSQNKDDLLKEMNFGLFAASSLQRISNMIKQEKFEEALVEVKNYHGVVAEVFSKSQPKVQLDKFAGRVDALAKIVRSKQSKRSGAVKRKQSRGRAGSGRGRGRSMSKEEQEQNYSVMSSDSQEQVLYRQMRARSRSRSPR